MNIIVCLKRVPDTTAKIRPGPSGRSIDPQGVEFIISPYDEFAIEEALRLKEKLGTGEVVGLTVDPDGQDTILRKALAMGLDRGILVKGGDPFDGAATAEILAGVLKEQKFDLLLFGKQAIDSDSGQVPPMVAHRLGLPRALVVTRFDYADKRVVCRRQIEGGEEVVALPLPCLVAMTKGPNEPRYPSLKGIMAAKKKPVQVLEAPPVAPRLEVVKLEPPPERPPGRVIGQGVDAVPELVRLLREEAKVL
jgi:electron transfer flavoprotein beta subunit